jgi:hypothetical protein
MGGRSVQWAGRSTSSCSNGMAHDDAGSLCLGLPLRSVAALAHSTTTNPPPMPVYIHALPPSTPQTLLLAHPRCALHVMCDILYYLLPADGALRNHTAFHNPSPRLQPRRMGADQLHIREKLPLALAYVSWMCVCTYCSIPFSSRVPTSLTCIQTTASRATTYTKHSTSIIRPTETTRRHTRCQSTVAKARAPRGASASQCRNRSYVVR